jgi:translation elongation factor EF-G
VLPVLARLRAVPQTPAMRGSLCLLEGEIPAAQVHELEKQLPALTRGEGVLEGAFDHYQPVRGTIPAGRGPTTTRSTARNTCCTSCGGWGSTSITSEQKPRAPQTCAEFTDASWREGRPTRSVAQAARR